MKSKKSESVEKQPQEQPRRIRLITGLAVEYTVGPPHDDDLQVIDGNQIATEHDIARAIVSEECMVLSKLMEDAALAFAKRYPNSRASAHIIPINGFEKVPMIELELD